MKELLNLEKVEGSQGVLYKAQWKGRLVIYKQVLLKEGDEKREFEKEFRVWQYGL